MDAFRRRLLESDWISERHGAEGRERQAQANGPFGMEKAPWRQRPLSDEEAGQRAMSAGGMAPLGCVTAKLASHCYEESPAGCPTAQFSRCFCSSEPLDGASRQIVIILGNQHQMSDDVSEAHSFSLVGGIRQTQPDFIPR
ncbi:hypothetical protein ASE66_27895 [Bosea sp. Root483D1]|nr:hypothetical protein ASE66_27895 [Bosea sp. Root483D1]